VVPGARAPGPARPVLSLQRKLGNRAVGRLLARAPTPRWSGTVFLPGDDNVGHTFRLEGTNIVEGAGKTKRTAGTIAADGRYTLVDENGDAITGATGNVSELTGQVSKQGGAGAGRVTSTTGSGDFSLSDPDGTSHALAVADGGVYSGTGKHRQLVGDIDAAGRYRVKLTDQVVTGSLTDPAAPVSVRSASFKRADRTQVLDQLQIGVTPVPEGILVFPEGTYTIKNGQLYLPGGRQPVGNVKVVKTGPKLEHLSLPVSYQQWEETGDSREVVTHQTDAARSVPAEGSVLRLGRGRDWIVSSGGAWVDMSGTPVHKGYELFGGGRLTKTLVDLRTKRKIQVTDDEIDLMQGVAEVESAGFTQTVNTWDSDVVSLGFMQYTMAGSLQELIDLAPAAFARYGIVLSGNLPLIRGGQTDSVRAVQGVTNLQDLRKLEWAMRFYRAGLDPEIIAAEVEKAKGEFADITAHNLSAANLPAELTTARVKAIIFELHNNRPAYVAAVVRDAAAEIRKHPGASQDDVIGFVLDAMETQYVDNNTNSINGATDDDARKKARDIVSRTGQAFPNPK
jgi:hypothetical protein